MALPAVDNPHHLRHPLPNPLPHSHAATPPATHHLLLHPLSPPRPVYMPLYPFQPRSSSAVHSTPLPCSSPPSSSSPGPEAMASLTAAAVSIPRFTGLKAGSASKVAVAAAVPTKAAAAPVVGVRASLKEVGVAVVATAASAILASNALAIDVKLGGDDGSLAFVPSEFTVAAGEKIVFKNNAGFPHNVIFDEDEVPSGVNATAISMSEEDLLNAPGEEYSVTLNEKGTYTFYCSPHQGAGMVGKVTVN